jgi:hypothetical protein
VGRSDRLQAASGEVEDPEAATGKRGLRTGAEEGDEVGGGGVVSDGWCGGGLEFGEDSGGEYFAELDAPLVEAVDGPDDTLGKDGVFVESDEGAEKFGGEEVVEEDVGGAVALEDLVRDEGFGNAFGPDFGGCLAEGEGFGLGEDVGHEHVVMAAVWASKKSVYQTVRRPRRTGRF